MSDVDDEERDDAITASAMASKAFGDDDDSEDDETLDDQREKRAADDGDFGDRPRKRSRMTADIFLDDMAADDEDDMGKDQDGGHMDREQIEMLEEQNRNRESRGAAFDPRNVDVEETARRLEERYRQEKRVKSRRHRFTGDESEMTRPLPNVRDFSMYALKCQEGKEVAAAMALTHKTIDMESQNKRTGISSIMSRGTKGYIYVEAEGDDEVVEVCKGLSLVLPYYKNGVTLVPIDDRVNTLRVVQKTKPVKPGDFVRLKRPMAYKGDLAEVLMLVNYGDNVVVRYVPRIDYPSLDRDMTPSDRKMRKRRVRAAQRIFDESDLKTLAPANSEPFQYKVFEPTGDRMKFYAGLYLTNGFAHKSVSVKAITTMNVRPTIDEITLLKSTQNNRNENDDEYDDDEEAEEAREMRRKQKNEDEKNLLEMVQKLHRESNAAKKITFLPGDKIRSIEGALADQTGVVVSVDAQSGEISVKLDIEGYDDIVPFSPNELAKYVDEGEHVKVVSGRYVGKTGMVVHTENAGQRNSIAVLKDDNGGGQIKVFASDLHVSLERASGQDSLGGYNLHDLVELASGSTGVIVAIGASDVTVLMQEGDRKVVVTTQLGGKRNRISSNAVARDSDQVNIVQGDTVYVIRGEHRGQFGTIKHIHREKWLFLHSSALSENGGFFVTRSEYVRRSGSALNETSGTSVRMKKTNFRRRDPLVGARVRICGKGKYRRKLGTVRGVVANGKEVRVLLDSVRREVQFPSERVKREGARGDAEALRTPAPDMGMGSRTPGIGSQTPRGSRTPAGTPAPSVTYDEYGRPQTPRRSMTPGPFELEDAWDPSVTATPQHHGLGSESREPSYSPPTSESSSVYASSLASSAPQHPTSWYETRGAMVSWSDRTGARFSGAVVEPLRSGNVRVRLKEVGRNMEVPGRDLSPVVPKVGKQLLVIKGEYKGQYGVLNNRLNLDEVIVKLDESIQAMPVSNVTGYDIEILRGTLHSTRDTPPEKQHAPLNPRERRSLFIWFDSETEEIRF